MSELQTIFDSILRNGDRDRSHSSRHACFHDKINCNANDNNCQRVLVRFTRPLTPTTFMVGLISFGHKIIQNTIIHYYNTHIMYIIYIF